jgi:ribosomal protein S18 acetylase RimI-like enzyme
VDFEITRRHEEPQSSLGVRDARLSDAETVVGWFSDYPAARSWGGPAVPDPLTADWLRLEMLDTSHVYRSAVLSAVDNVVGFCGLQLVLSEHRVHVRRLAAAPHRRRAGVGRQLLEDAAELGSRLKMRRLTLNVYGANTSAMAVYERLGWRYLGSSPDPEDTSGLRHNMERLIGECRSELAPVLQRDGFS